MKRNMTFVWGTAIILFSALLFAAKSKGDEVPEVLYKMHDGLQHCEETPEEKSDTRHYSGLLTILSDSQKGVLSAQVLRMFGDEAARSFSSASHIVLEIKRYGSEILEAQDFTYHVINKNPSGAWCYEGKTLNGSSALNSVFARALNIKYLPQ